EAEDELTCKEMRAYAWVELQRGAMDLACGRYEEAHIHYQRAGKAYTGYWLVGQHRAGLLGATGKLDQAAVLYESVLARAAKPELRQTLGELYEHIGDRERARRCFDQALTAYLDAGSRGGVHYYHHLADYYADVAHDGEEAIKWAAKDLEL